MKKRLQAAVQFDTKILDANSRVSRMLDNLIRVLEAEGQEWVLDQEGKLVASDITDALKPAPLQVAMAKQLKLHRNKNTKTDLFEYVMFLRKFVAGYQLYGGLENEKPTKPTDEKPSGASTASSAARVEKGEPSVKKLMDDLYQARRRSVNSVKSPKEANSMVCRATVDDVLALPGVLIDPGSDETLVPEGVAGAGAPRSSPQRGDESNPDVEAIQKNKQAPPLLRGLQAWVEEKILEVDVLIGRPIMEHLGFSVFAMLIDALKQRRVWNVTDVGVVGHVSSSVSRLQAAL
ncbi:hypothetical protein H310_07192 [Aphanomyces invadans]|uniref:Uncharacterized protein n=1 Tax=Aphanomyces invadans TaxID=157072 RepID=A0A024U2F5_9STRA|nr:hypothetical protein H310_07192 [Aphanomyces invadans]ETW00621.1 hypothetical protein H310_07192 [Aphanomyces invadans]|eukprot:XP_008870756.1 hypothetical protein H310_07192 [Aphanomyces invadans]